MTRNHLTLSNFPVRSVECLLRNFCGTACPRRTCAGLLLYSSPHVPEAVAWWICSPFGGRGGFFLPILEKHPKHLPRDLRFANRDILSPPPLNKTTSTCHRRSSSRSQRPLPPPLFVERDGSFLRLREPGFFPHERWPVFIGSPLLCCCRAATAELFPGPVRVQCHHIERL